MPRIAQIRQRRHQPFWASLVRALGPLTTPIASGAKLFSSIGGNKAETNMQTAGVLPSDQTYVILSARVFMHFEGTNKRTNYRRVASQMFNTLYVGDAPQFEAPCWYYPAGGGIAGHDATESVLNNGEPTTKSIMLFAKPISVPVRQHFAVQCDFWSIGTVNALDLLNAGAANDEKVITFMIDGVHTRDVQ